LADKSGMKKAARLCRGSQLSYLITRLPTQLETKINSNRWGQTRLIFVNWQSWLYLTLSTMAKESIESDPIDF